MQIVSSLFGIFGSIAAIYFGLKQLSTKKIMRTFIQTIAAQSQGVADCLVELKQADFNEINLPEFTLNFIHYTLTIESD